MDFLISILGVAVLLFLLWGDPIGLLFDRKGKVSNGHIEALPSEDVSEDQMNLADDDTCYHCYGIGWEFTCRNCGSQVFLSNDDIDDRLTCDNCYNKGDDFNNISQEICFFCDGKGKH